MANEFDETVERAMDHVGRKEWRSALEVFKEALELDRKEEGGDISEERADCAYNIACCAAQLGDLDESEAWVRRAVAWGVRNVHPETDDDLEPLRTDTAERLERFLDAVEPLLKKKKSASQSTTAVLERTKRSNAGRGMGALAREMEAEGWGEDDEDDEGFSSADEDEQDQRDVFDSDFNDSEDDDDDGDDGEQGRKISSVASKKTTKKKIENSSRRAAARKAEAMNAVAVNRMEEDEDDEDGDFEDSGGDGDVEIGAPIEPRSQSAREAVSEAVRKRKVEDAWKELDGDEVEEPPTLQSAVEQNSSFPIPKKKKRRRLYRRRTGKKSAIIVLSRIFGREAAEKIIAKAKANIAKRESQVESERKFVTTETIVETKYFAGEKVQVRRTMRSDEAHAAAAQKTTGIDAVIAGLKGPQAITTVEKSSSDWDAFKSKEGIEDSLRDADKKGYLANKDFLERCDNRAFDRERDERERLRALRDAAATAK